MTRRHVNKATNSKQALARKVLLDRQVELYDVIEKTKKCGSSCSNVIIIRCLCTIAVARSSRCPSLKEG